MNEFTLAIGVALAVVGGYSVARREAVVARHRVRSSDRHPQSPHAYLVMGAILLIAGTVMLTATIIKLL